MTDLQREIFGGSDDSDLSDEEPIDIRTHSPEPYQPRHIEEDEDEEAEESAASDQDGDFRDDAEQAQKLPSFKKRDVSERDASHSAPKSRRRKPKKVAPVETELPVEIDLTPDEKRRLELNRAIDAAARSGRSSRPRKRKKGDEDVLDAAADEEVLKMKVAMMSACTEDQEDNKNGKPALAKLKMLPEVLEVLQKQALSQSIIDQNLLEAVRAWLEPLPDKSLPALNIQRVLFETLGKMFIDTSALKESGLGRIVLFYTKKNKRVPPVIKAQADNLVSQWSRPILKQSASYRDREMTLATDADLSTAARRTIKLSRILEQSRLDDASRVKRNAVRVPERDHAAYSIVPRSSSTAGGGAQAQADLERRRIAQERLRKVQRKVEFSRQKAARM